MEFHSDKQTCSKKE
jgi:hypothetical protein